MNMPINFSFVTSLPDPTEFEAMMVEYYALMIDKLVVAGGPRHLASDLASDTMLHMDDLMPPNGRTLLAHSPDGKLVGCGVLRKIRPDAAELKRMYVRPEAQGTGLGRKLFELRMAEARKMGCKRLYADTVMGNTAMLTMYEKMGFKFIPRYPENANGPDLEPFLVYLEYVLPEDD